MHLVIVFQLELANRQLKLNTTTTTTTTTTTPI